MEQELLQLERQFANAIVRNDADAIEEFLAGDWAIVDPDGRVVNRSRFLDVIRSGSLTHESMESTDTTVRVYRECAVVTGVTTSTGKFMDQEFTTRERATDLFVKQEGNWRCVFSQLTRYTDK